MLAMLHTVIHRPKLRKVLMLKLLGFCELGTNEESTACKF